MAGDYQPFGREPDGGAAPQQSPVTLHTISPARWALLVLNIVLFVVCAFAMATSPLAPWYRVPNAGAAPLSATASATAPLTAPTYLPPPVAPTSTPRSSGGGPAPTATSTPRPTATSTPLGPPTATPSPLAPTPTNTPSIGN